MKKFYSRKLNIKKQFVNFFISYIIIFLIPFSAIYFTYLTAQKSIKQEIINSSYNNLYQFFRVVDSKFSEMQKACLSLVSSPLLQQYSTYNRNGLEIPHFITYEIKQNLITYRQNDFQDIFFYYHDFDQIFSTDNKLESRLFHQTYYKDMMSYESFTALMNSSRANLVPRLVSLDHNTEKATLAVMISHNMRYVLGAPQITAVITLRNNTLNDLFHSANFISNNILMIFDKDNQLLASSREISSDFSLPSHKDVDGLYNENFESDNYIIQVFSSRVVDCTYVSAIPSNVFWARLNNLRFVIILSTLLCILFSFFTAYYMAKRNYSPITSILHTISNKTNYVYDKRYNEMDFISDVIHNSLEEIHTLNSKLENKSDTLRQNFLLRALQGNYFINENSDDDAFLQNSITLISEWFSVFLIQIEKIDDILLNSNKEKNNPIILRFILANVIQELCSYKHQGFLVNIAPAQYACIVNFNDSSTKNECLLDIRSIAEQSYEFVQLHFGIYTTASISGIHSGLSGIHSAYQESLYVMKYRFLYGKNSIIPFTEVANKTFCYDNSTDSKAAQFLHEYVTINGSDQSEYEMVSKIMSFANINENSSLDALECFRYDTISIIRKLIHEIGADNLEKENRFIESLLKAETLADFQGILARALHTFHIHSKESKANNTICDKAKSFIQEHYMDPNINNSTIGDCLGISPSYLSRMFKLQMGIALIDYLYKIRIEKAKVLLQDTALSIEDIALKTGYLSSSTFIKTFKKSEGITPGAYRKLKLSKKI